eukprot:7142547-Pyramimonas_sp.AAC.1
MQQPGPPSTDALDTKELQQMVTMLERVGDVAGAQKHKRTLQEREKRAAAASYVPPLSHRVTAAHKKYQDMQGKLQAAINHFDTLQQQLDSQRLWVAEVTRSMERAEAEHRDLVRQLNASVVDFEKDDSPAPI